MKYATTSPEAGVKLADGSPILVLCKSGYTIGDEIGHIEGHCNSTINTLKDCHSKIISLNFKTVNDFNDSNK